MIGHIVLAQWGLQLMWEELFWSKVLACMLLHNQQKAEMRRNIYRSLYVAVSSEAGACGINNAFRFTFVHFYEGVITNASSNWYYYACGYTLGT